MNTIVKDFLSLTKKAFSLRDATSLVEAFGDYWKLGKTGQSGYVGSSVNTMGLYFTKAKFRLYDTSEGSMAEIQDHPFINITKLPNNFQTWWEIKYYIGDHFATKGNYYLLKLRNTKTDLWNGIVTLDPSRVEIKSSSKQFIDHYIYNLGTERIRLEPDEVIHLRFPNSNSIISGESIMSKINEVLEIDKSQNDYTKKFYDEGGFNGNVFSTNAKMDRESFTRAERQLQAKFGGGSRNAFKVALFEQGLQPVKGAYSIKDMDLSNQRKLTANEIMTAFRIPQILYGGMGDNYNRSSAEAGQFAYASTFIDPLLDYVDESFTRHIRMEWGSKWTLKHDSVAPKDVEGQVKYIRELVDAGLITRNEGRDLEDYERSTSPFADKLLVNVGGAMVDIDTGEQLGSKPNNTINTDSKSKEFEELRWKQFNRRFDREYKLLIRKVENYFNDQKMRLLTELNKKDLFLVEDFFNSFENAALLALFSGEIMRIIKQGHNYSSTIVDVTPFSPTNPFVQGQLNQMLRNAEGINNTTKESLINKIKNNVGFSNEQIIELIENEYDMIEKSRIPAIVNTTVGGGLNAGLLYGFRQAGVKKKVWLTMRDNIVRDDHQDADGQERELDENFNVGEEVLMYPGDPLGSAKQTINCRCTMLAKN